MKKTIIFVAVQIAMASLVQAVLPHAVAGEFGAGKISGKTGVNFRVDNAASKDLVDNGDIGFGFFEVDFTSRDLKNLIIGAELIAVGKIWTDDVQKNAFDDEGIFQKKVLLKSCYVKYSVPNTGTKILAGRKEFNKSESMDGDSHQGIELSTEDIPGTTLYLAAINRWLEDASTDYSLDGIQKTWRQGDDTGESVADTVYSIIAEIDMFEDRLTLTPYYNVQKGALSNYGASFEFESDLNAHMKIGLDGIYSFYDENTDDPDDEDAASFLIHTTFSYQNFRLGIGYYEMSDDARVDFTAMGNDTFDPMEEGVYGGDPDDNTIFLDAGYSSDSWKIEIMLGETDIDATGEGSTELDVYFTCYITEVLALELMFVTVDDNDSDLDYRVFAGGLHISF